MLKLALLFSFTFSLGITFDCLALEKKREIVVDRGHILFQVERELYELSQLQEAYRQLKVFSCLYSGSVLLKFLNISKKEGTWILNQKQLPSKLLASQRETLAKFLRYIKLVHYIREQQIYMASSLAPLLKESSKVNQCAVSGFFRGNKMADNLNQMVKIEVMLSQRKKTLTPLEQDGGISAFFSTVNKQLPHQILW